MALITYDVSAKQAAAKKALKTLGYLDHWTADGVTYHLPNTTLWKKDVAVETAIADMKKVASHLGVKLERAVAVPASPWHGIIGMPHAE